MLKTISKMKKEEKEKVHLNDIVEGKAMREVGTFEVGGKRYWADRITKDSLATHRDCADCGIEFEKKYTFDKYCFNCESKNRHEKFNSMEVAEWNGSDAVCLYDGNQYFFDMDDIEQYCEDNEIEPSSLRLLLCKPTTFGSINIAECLQDDLHEDWEPDAELNRIQKELDKYLRTPSTNTWMPTNKRIIL